MTNFRVSTCLSAGHYNSVVMLPTSGPINLGSHRKSSPPGMLSPSPATSPNSGKRRCHRLELLDAIAVGRHSLQPLDHHGHALLHWAYISGQSLETITARKAFAVTSNLPKHREGREKKEGGNGFGQTRCPCLCSLVRIHLSMANSWS